MQALFIKISGRVHGVGFRYFTYKLANKMKVKGYVRNAEDGSVEIHAEAPEEILVEFLKAVSIGPPMATVISVKYERVAGQNFTSFDIVP